MIVSRNRNGTLLSGKVLSWKSGIGTDSDNLTILSLESNKKILKILCWDTEILTLSSKARKLKTGDMVSIFGKFDIGNPDLMIAEIIKKNGLYTLKEDDDTKKQIVYSKIHKYITTDKGVYLMLPLFDMIKKENIYYMVFLCHEKINQMKQYIKRGIPCFVFYDNLQKIDIKGIEAFICEGEKLFIETN